MKRQHISLIRAMLAASFGGALTLSQAPVAAAAQSDAPKLVASARGAKPDLATAKKRYNDGKNKFHVGDFAGALADFQIANDIKATPQAERYIGRCLDLLGRTKDAVDWYEKFLAHVPPKMAAQGDKTRARLAEIISGKPHVESSASRSADADAPAGPTGEEELAGGSPAGGDEPAPAPSGAPSPSSAASSAATQASNGSPSSSSSGGADAADGAGEASSSADAAAARGPNRLPAFIVGGAAVAAAGVGTVFGVIALTDKADFDMAMNVQNGSKKNQHALIADVSFGAAIALGVTSTVLFITTRERSPSPDSAVKPPPEKVAGASQGVTLIAAPFVGPHGGGAGLLMQF